MNVRDIEMKLMLCVLPQALTPSTFIIFRNVRNEQPHISMSHHIVPGIFFCFTIFGCYQISENIGPLWRRKYYVIPPQGLHNITSSIEAQNNRSVTHHSVLTIGDDVTLIAKNYGGDCDWFTERSCDLSQKLWLSL